MENIAKGRFRSLNQLVTGKFTIDRITFYGMDDVWWPDKDKSNVDNYNHFNYNMQLENGSTINSAERHYGIFGLKTESFIANVSFTRVEDMKEVTCGAFGLSKMIRGDKLNPNYLFIKYDVTLINYPFKHVTINEWTEDVSGKELENWIFIDPVCCNFKNGSEHETARFTTAIDEILMRDQLRNALVNFMKDIYIKWIIEPNRFKLTGRVPIPLSTFGFTQNQWKMFVATFG